MSASGEMKQEMGLMDGGESWVGIAVPRRREAPIRLTVVIGLGLCALLLGAILAVGHTRPDVVVHCPAAPLGDASCWTAKIERISMTNTLRVSGDIECLVRCTDASPLDEFP